MSSSMAERGSAAAPRKPRCIAEAMVGAGAHAVLIDFINAGQSGGDLMPMAEQVARAIAWAWRNAESFGGDRNRFYVSAHSSGAHLAACALSRGWRAENLPPDFCKGALLVGGMYDLKPVRLSARSAYVKFTDAMEEALSPQRPYRRHHHAACPRARHLRDAGIPAAVARLLRCAQSQRKNRRADRRRRLQSLRAVRDDGQPLRPHRQSRNSGRWDWRRFTSPSSGQRTNSRFVVANWMFSPIASAPQLPFQIGWPSMPCRPVPLFFHRNQSQ